ncbi:thiolase family protein [Aeromonas diversa]|uniref:Acetyl-CoA acetyltransferase n=1 Tax=Aeromonas diversa CDC 2478-85 TaxID=1268237 RepID=N9U1J8_9GAMM|nr:thiolase family protein [Aeromonas diversa]ENY72229.1 acetyl-CoA acetyltransferase [Aeromonas diversa CDC 2478-85]
MEVVIVAARRTPMGSFMGALSALSAPELGAAVVRALLEQCGLRADAVDELYAGNVLSAGLGQAPARQMALLGGLAESVPCTTINKVCGSGMKSVMVAADQIRLGESRIALAGGMESMSRAPYLIDKARSGLRMGHQSLLDHLFLDGLQDAYEGHLMGHYAQRVADEQNMGRAEMDEYAIASLTRARQAIEEGAFASEWVRVTDDKGVTLLEVDEQPGKAKPEKIPHLKPAFGAGGTITAANASSISDGAAGLLLMSRDEAKRRGLPVLAKICGYCTHAAAPAAFTTAPIGAMARLLEQLGWRSHDVDLFEINEAFAMVPMLAMKAMDLTHDRVNVHGGACALGHPLGASGARILVTLIHALHRRGARRGVASLCIGGGEATALAVELL